MLRRHFVTAALALAASTLAAPGSAQTARRNHGPALGASRLAQPVTGAGSTLVFPLLSQWSRAYQQAQSDAEFQPVAAALDYEPIGSQAGVMRLKGSGVDFAATDMPLGSEELATYGFAQFPIALGGIAIAVNLDGVPAGRLRLTGEVLADIYLGEIKSWSDPRLKGLNPELTLPDAPIAVLRRQDGSGTTFNVTNYLGRLGPGWKEKVGEGLSVNWPVGIGAKGNDGMAAAVKRTRNAIGYVDFAQASRAGLAVAQIRNRAGEFITPSVEAFRAAAANADWAAAKDFNLLLNDAPGRDAYPIVATAFAVVRRENSHGTRGAVTFLDWALEHGAVAATELGYVPLPPSLVERVKAYWTGSLKVGL